MICAFRVRWLVPTDTRTSDPERTDRHTREEPICRGSRAFVPHDEYIVRCSVNAPWLSMTSRPLGPEIVCVRSSSTSDVGAAVHIVEHSADVASRRNGLYEEVRFSTPQRMSSHVRSYLLI